MSVDENRPPYVTFETQAMEDRAATLANGYYTEKEMDVAVITRPGSRDTLIKEATTWLKELEEKQRQGQIPPTWFPAFAASYKNWKSGETTEGITGTPIKGWSAIGAAQQKLLINVGIRSIEDLATIPDADVGQIGTGAIAMKQKAVAWLATVNSVGKTAERLAALEVSNKELAELVKKQAKELDSRPPAQVAVGTK